MGLEKIECSPGIDFQKNPFPKWPDISADTYVDARDAHWNIPPMPHVMFRTGIHSTCEPVNFGLSLGKMLRIIREQGQLVFRLVRGISP